MFRSSIKPIAINNRPEINDIKPKGINSVIKDPKRIPIVTITANPRVAPIPTL